MEKRLISCLKNGTHNLSIGRFVMPKESNTGVISKGPRALYEWLSLTKDGAMKARTGL